MKNIICIACPKGCRLTVDEQNGFKVTGNLCPKGDEYGKKEAQNPTRIITSTVKIKGAAQSRLPVKTDRDIDKSLIFQAMRLLDSVEITAPVKIGDTIIKDILSTGANFIATKNM